MPGQRCGRAAIPAGYMPNAATPETVSGSQAALTTKSPKGAIDDMSLILVSRNDIAVGQPLPWTLFDREYKVLVEQGGVVPDNAHLDNLLANDVYRELSWETPNDNNGSGKLSAAATAPDQIGAVGAGAPFTFDDMKLKAESRLQLEPPAQLGRERFLVKVIGYLRDVSLLVSAPITASGLRLQLMEGEKVVMRSFSGQNAFAFTCTIGRICKMPYEYLHLSFPDVIQGVVIRKAPRVKSKIIAAVQNTNSRNPGEQSSALISNISANGAALDAKRTLGNKGDVLNLAFRVNLHKLDAFLSVKGAIRAVIDAENADLPSTEIIRYGVEFQGLQPNDMVILQSMIYQQIIESPHQLV